MITASASAAASSVQTSRRLADAGHRASASTMLFAVTLLLGSALMFVVELMFARMVLPRLGGSPSVWNTCTVFFQAALLAGYIYAHVLSRLASVRKQVVLHLTLVVLAGLTLPVTLINSPLPPVDRSPIPWLLVTLAVGIGAPFVALSATSPLLQHWFGLGRRPAGKDPYHFYAASNVGSFVALLAYPVVIEPVLSLPEQSSTWTIVYWLFAALAVACAAVATRYAPLASDDRSAEHSAALSCIGWRQRTHWVTLAAVPSSLLISVTTYLSTDVAAVPLLWTIPLALYLLTFVCAFAPRRLISQRVTTRALPLALIPLVLLLVTVPAGGVFMVFPLHLAVFFLCALSLHMALADQRPPAAQLTEFYLWLGAGGVIGGLLTTLVAPLVFTDVTEYPLGLIAACVLQRRTQPGAKADFVVPAVIAAVVVSANAAVHARMLHPALFGLLMVGFGFVAFSCSRRPIRFALATAALLSAAIVPINANSRIYAARTFFGVLRVQASGPAERHLLVHGNTVHGEQDLRPGMSQEPRTYYHRLGPIGQVMTALRARLEGAHIGVVGLGAGSLAAYAGPDQQWTFFEIDPAVAAIANNPRLFTYMQLCTDRCRTVLGDARLSLARIGEERFRLLVLDAFSSDGIPVHLMTREALALYLAKLADDGVLAFHISNRHLDLQPVLSSLAAEQKLVAIEQYDPGSRDGDADGHYESHWVVMARDARTLAALTADPRWHLTRPSTARVWTDDYSNVLSLLRLKLFPKFS